MRLLKLGSHGDDVEQWEIFLKGFKDSSDIVVNDYFNKITHLETKEFQRAVGFTGGDVDGKVGRMTYAEAMKLGFDPIEDDREDEGPNWPVKPIALTQLGYVDRVKVFGQFAFKPAGIKSNPEAIKITDNWSDNNIKRVVIPQLVGVYGAPKSGGVYLHTKICDQTVSMFQAWEDARLKPLILSWAGSWVPRFIRGSRTTLSNHAWGTAFDINAAWNGLGRQPALKGKKGCVRELVEIANEHGWGWGGHFRRRKDGMHFECWKVL